MEKDGAHRIRALEQLRSEFARVAHDDTHTHGRRRLQLASFALAGLVVLTGGAVARIMIAGSVDEGARVSDSPESPRGTAQPPAYAGFTQYQTLREMVANSELVVVGTVQEVTPGYEEPSEDEFPTRYLNTVLKVEETWRGTPAETITLATNELAYGNPAGGSEWRSPGVRVVAFLVPGDSGPSGLFYPADEPGIYVVNADQVDATVRGTTVGDQIASMTLEELRQAVQAVVDAS